MKTPILVYLLLLLTSAAAQQTQTEPDPRIRKHYTADQIEEMQAKAPQKIIQLNYYFKHSYAIIGPTVSKEIGLADFDVMEYEKYRKENERVLIGLTREGHLLELLSLNELREKYKQL